MRIERGVKAPAHVQFGKKLTEVPIGIGIDSVEDLYAEVEYYWDVLLGREDPPVTSPYLDLMEVAYAYYARAMEIHGQILEGERSHKVIKGSPYNKFRCGYLRDFIEVSKKATDLGSRRLTQEALMYEMREEST